jgi:1,4-dihydroxy-2-naphthoate polyprenyltransferase
MIRSSTIQLLRFHFSFFLMPVYWFALSQVMEVNWPHALLIFFILHLLVYPSSNGYNSYMDRDTESVGGIKNPKAPTRQLFYVSVTIDIIAIALSFFMSIYFAMGIFLYIMASRAYSYRGIRLKKYPVTGYLTVIFFQGAVTYFLVTHGSSISQSLQVSPLAMTAASLLVGGFYPLTQIYQHRQDKADGVRTLSILLGYRGTFIFTAAIYFVAMILLGIYFADNLELDKFIIFQTFMLPVLVYFSWWFYKVWKDVSHADFTNTMRMNLLASVCTNAAFITILISDKF